MEKRIRPTKVVTGEGVLSYLNCWEPHAMDETSTPKYSVSFVFPKSDTKTYDKIVAAMKAAYDEGADKLKSSGGKIPPFDVKSDKLKMALRDGDDRYAESGDETYKGCWFVNASSKEQPGVVDRNKVEIMDTREMYSGVIGRISVNFYVYNKNGNKGIAAGLQNIQKIRDGQPLGGKSRAEDDFDDEYSSDEDFL